jgi:hypothetical protein
VIPWGLTFRFLKLLALGLWFFSPLLIVLVVVLLLGYLAGKQEGWSRSDSLYWAFVTATTVGYGDFRPSKRRSRIIAVIIAVLGLLTTGIINALGVCMPRQKLWIELEVTTCVPSGQRSKTQAAINDRAAGSP